CPPCRVAGPSICAVNELLSVKGVATNTTSALEINGRTSRRMRQEFIRLKQQAQRQLGNARIARGGDLAEGRGAKRCVHTRKLRVIEQIEEFRAELHRYAFGDRRSLDEGHVPVISSRSAYKIATGAPEAAERGIRERGGAEPAGQLFVN